MMKPKLNNEGGAGQGVAKEETEMTGVEGNHKKGYEGASARIRTSMGHTIRITGSIANIVLSILSMGCSIVSIAGSLKSIRASEATMTGQEEEKQRIHHDATAGKQGGQTTSSKLYRPVASDTQRGKHGRRRREEKKRGERPPFSPCTGIG